MQYCGGVGSRITFFFFPLLCSLWFYIAVKMHFRRFSCCFQGKTNSGSLLGWLPPATLLCFAGVLRKRFLPDLSAITVPEPRSPGCQGFGEPLGPPKATSPGLARRHSRRSAASEDLLPEMNFARVNYLLMDAHSKTLRFIGKNSPHKWRGFRKKSAIGSRPDDY